MEELIMSITLALRNLFGQTARVNSARVDAVKQTVIALNHEINNPLTVVLGNAELLLMKGEQLPEEVKLRLESIVQAGLKIRDAVVKMSHVTDAKSTIYVRNVQMIDSQNTAVSE
jgi:signal transduction histidine kinase